MKPVIILDSSIITKWFRSVGEEKIAQARAYRDQVEREEILVIAPDLLYYEMVNVAKNDKTQTEELWEESLDAIFSLPFEISLPDKNRFLQIFNLAKQLDISTYDACYLALAKERNTVLVTCDKELLTKAPDLTKPL